MSNQTTITVDTAKLATLNHAIKAYFDKIVVGEWLEAKASGEGNRIDYWEEEFSRTLTLLGKLGVAVEKDLKAVEAV